ncbi:MAG: MarR family winged helix-turn-helix transcriptional regulator [Patescibacteria group bacterium]
MKKDQISVEMQIVSSMHKLVYRLDREADADLHTELNISFHQFMILMVSRSWKNPTQQVIAKQLNISAGALSRQVDTLVQKGLITRTQNKENRREQHLRATAQGVEVSDQAYHILNAGLEKLFSCLTKTEQSQLTVMLQKLDAFNGGSEEDPCQ